MRTPVLRKSNSKGCREENGTCAAQAARKTNFQDKLEHQPTRINRHGKPQTASRRTVQDGSWKGSARTCRMPYVFHFEAPWRQARVQRGGHQQEDGKVWSQDCRHCQGPSFALELGEQEEKGRVQIRPFQGACQGRNPQGGDCSSYAQQSQRVSSQTQGASRFLAQKVDETQPPTFRIRRRFRRDSHRSGTPRLVVQGSASAQKGARRVHQEPIVCGQGHCSRCQPCCRNNGCSENYHARAHERCMGILVGIR